MQCLRRSAALRSFRGTSLEATQRTFAIRSSKATPVVAVGRPKKNSKKKDDSEPKRDKEQEWENLMNTVNNKYGTGTMLSLSAKPLKIARFSTGLLSLDIMLGGGIPAGTIIEVHGPEGSGKTTLALHIMAEAQRPDNAICYIDAENALNPEYAVKVGLTDRRCFRLNAGKGEEVFDIMSELLRARTLKAICVDSVAALCPAVEQEAASIEDAQVAALPRLMSKGIRTLQNILSHVGEDDLCTVVFVNQLRTKIGVFGNQNPEVRPGGRALAYGTFLILDVRAGPKMQGENAETIGHKVRIKAIKNKAGSPHTTVELELYYGKGFCRVSSLLDAAVQMDVLTLNSSYYKFNGEHLAHGKARAVELLTNDPNLARKIEEATWTEFIKRSELEERPPIYYSNFIPTEPNSNGHTPKPNLNGDGLMEVPVVEKEEATSKEE